MEGRVRLSKDGSSIDFTASDNLPTSLKKFRQSPEIEGFYRFIFENDLQKEAFEILERIIQERKAKKALSAKSDKADTKAGATKVAAKAPPTPAKAPAKPVPAPPVKAKAPLKAAPAKTVASKAKSAAPAKKGHKPLPAKKKR